MDNLLIAFLIESSIWDHDSTSSNKIFREKNPITGTVEEAKHDRNLIIVSQTEMVATTGGHSFKLCICTGSKYEYIYNAHGIKNVMNLWDPPIAKSYFLNSLLPHRREMIHSAN